MDDWKKFNSILLPGKEDFEKYLFKLINIAVFGKTLGNVRQHRGIKLVTTEARRNYLVSEPNFDTTKNVQKIY